jgi:Domain of unknown function (DUF4167)
MNEMWNRTERPQRRRPPVGGQRGAMALNNQNRSDGNAQRNYARYIALAKEAASRGDTIEAENCYQYAEHYFRTMRESERGSRD